MFTGNYIQGLETKQLATTWNGHIANLVSNNYHKHPPSYQVILTEVNVGIPIFRRALMFMY